MLETSLSIALLLTSCVCAWACRKSFIAISFVAFALFFCGLPLLRILAGGQTYFTSEEAIVLTYFSGLVYVLSSTIVALWVKDKSLLRFRNNLERYQFNTTDLKASLFVLSVTWALRIYTASAYGLLFSGSASAEVMSNLPYWLSAISSITAVLSGGAVILLLLNRNNKNHWLVDTVVITELIWSFAATGRREFIFVTLVVASIGVIRKHRSVHRMLAYCVFGTFALFTLTPIFLETRNINSTLQAAGYSTFEALTAAATEALHTCGFTNDCSDYIVNNMAERGNVLEFFKSIVFSQLNGASLLLGEGLATSLQWGIPSIFVEKPSLMTEQFIQVYLGLPFHDDAISLIALAYADGALVGVLLCGAALACFILFFLRLQGFQRIPFFVFANLYGLFSVLWNIEVDPLAHISLVRNALILSLFGFFISSLIKSRKQPI